jgi:5-aminopentanamidase
MRIAIFQGPARPGGVSENLDRLAGEARLAASAGARLLICPEMFLSGYAIGAEAAARLAEPSDGPSARRAAAIARHTGVALLYGYPERGPDEAVYNAAMLIDSEGRTLLNYRKSHLFGDLDRGMFKASGSLPPPATIEGWRIGVLICYDVEFPENVRRWALQGVELLCVPTALMEPYDFVSRGLVPARAYENQIFVAYANRCGREGETVYLGQSCIVAPDGADLARAGLKEELITADLDRRRLEQSRALNTYFADRRPELYAALTAPTAGEPR